MPAERANDNPIIVPLPPLINTAGGAYIVGTVDTGGGDFIGRDKIIVNTFATLPDVPLPPEPTRPTALPLFVGRKAELADYSDKLARLHIAVISGMAGIGKSTLATALARQVKPSEQIFWHTFHQGEGAAVVLWKLAGFLAWHGDGELWHLLQNIRQLGGQAPPIETLFDYLLQSLRAKSFLLCFDDFHCVDEEPTLKQFINRLHEPSQPGHLAIIIVTRRSPDFMTAGPFPPLAGLALEDVRQLLEARSITLSERLVEQLQASTAGNAQLLTLAIDLLRQGKNAIRVIQRLADEPEVETYLLTQVDKGLTQTERLVMEAVALLLGYPGTRALIETIIDRGSIKRTLTELGNRNLLLSTENELGRVYHQHAIVQMFYYDMLSMHERSAMHGRAALFYAATELELLNAGLHYLRAGDYAQAAQLLTKDIWALVNQGQVRVLLSLLEQLDENRLNAEELVPVYLARGQVYGVVGNQTRALADLQTGFVQLEALPQSPVLRERNVQFCYALGELLATYSPQAAVAWLQRGLQLSSSITSREEAALRIKFGFVQMLLGNYSDAQKELQAGYERLPATPSHLYSEALIQLGQLAFIQGELAAAQHHALLALEIARRLHNHFWESEILINLGVYKYTAGDWPGGIADFEHALKLAVRLGNEKTRAALQLNLGAAYINIANDEQALAYLQDSLALVEQTELRIHQPTVYFRLADLHIRRKEWAAAHSALIEAEKVALLLADQSVLSAIHAAWAELELAAGRYDGAQAHSQQAVELARALGETFDEGIAWRIHGQIAAARQHFADAISAFEQSLACFQEQDPYEEARTNTQLSLVLKTLGETERAAQLLKVARATFLTLGAKRDLAELIDNAIKHRTNV